MLNHLLKLVEKPVQDECRYEAVSEVFDDFKFRVSVAFQDATMSHNYDLDVFKR